MSDGSSTTLNVRADVPLVLLPVRLETRVSSADQRMSLLVRVYPDDVHADSHDERLTAAELQWGRHFWIETWRAGGASGLQEAAWRQLAEQFGGPRAAYIAERLRPSNASAMPTVPTPELVFQPDVPEISPRAPGWSRPPMTRVLPDRWIAIAYIKERRFVHIGPTITPPLRLAPALDAPNPLFDPRNPGADRDAGWLFDFAAAEQAGMALRMALDVPPDATIDRLLVFGTKVSSGEEGAALLEELLTAHRFASGLAFAPQGAVTNNTATERSAVSSSETPERAGPLGDERVAAVNRGAGSNAETTAQALGIDPATLLALEHGALEEQRDAYHMNTALWKATLGYFLEHLLAEPGTPLERAARDVRQYFASFVRARGPLPAIRVGMQPYGLLPVISLDRWDASHDTLDRALVALLRALRARWRQQVDTVPKVTPGEDDVQPLLEVLAMHPTSVTYTARDAHPIVSLGSAPAVARFGSDWLRDLATQNGVDWVPLQMRILLAPRPTIRELDIGRVQPAEEKSERAPAYLAALAGARWERLRDLPASERPATLLFLLLRHALLREYADAAQRLLVRHGAAAPDAVREIEVDGRPGVTGWSALKTVVPALGTTDVGAFLDDMRRSLALDPEHNAGGDSVLDSCIWQRDAYRPPPGLGSSPSADAVVELAAFARSLSYLSTCDVPVLERILAETLDLCSHRFDAWVTSLATKRLEEMRRTVPRGVMIGGYGWVEGIAAQTRTLAEPSEVPGQEPPDRPIYVSPDNFGYMQAPSLAHATTAAILRSGYLSRFKTRDGAALAVNLGSRRMRIAQWLLEGVRTGQPLGALLGYRFERGLHENHAPGLLDQFIESFRALAPLSSGGPASAPGGGGSQESIDARSVVDGLALLQRYRAARLSKDPVWTRNTIPFGSDAPAGPPLPGPLDPRFSAIVSELDALDDAVDAIADVTLAEAVHQMAQGNSERARAALEAIAMGEAPPPQLEVIETPRTGLAVTHRVVVLIDTGRRHEWPASTPRSRAEPRLAAWVGALLGPSALDARCRVTYLDPQNGDELRDADGHRIQRDITVRDLQLAPIDIVYAQHGEGPGSASEIQQRLAVHALRAAPDGVRPSEVTSGAAVRLETAAQPDWPSGTLSLATVLEVARAVRAVVGSTRAIDGDDLSWSDAASEDEPPKPAEGVTLSDVADLDGRATAAVDACRVLAGAFAEALSLDSFNIDAARQLLFEAALFGVPGAIPLAAFSGVHEASTLLRVQLVSVERELRKRVRAVEERQAAFTHPPDPVALRKHHTGRLKDVFGEAFLPLPLVRPADPAALTRALAGSHTLQAGDPLEAGRWLHRAARVRDGVARFERATMYGEAVGGEGLRLTVGQLPYGGPDDRWAALPSPTGALRGGRLSVVIQSATVPNVEMGVAGLVVDEWVETVPNAVETTGMAFNYNRPNSRAPQAILLAISPDAGLTWDLEALEATLLETLELAKLRTVDVTQLAELRDVLPAIYLAQPGVNDTVTSEVPQPGGGS